MSFSVKRKETLKSRLTEITITDYPPTLQTLSFERKQRMYNTTIPQQSQYVTNNTLSTISTQHQQRSRYLSPSLHHTAPMMTDLPPTGAFEEDASTPPSPSSNSSFIVATKMEPTPIQRVLGCDAFSYYSNKFNLMKTLLLQDDDIEVLPSAGITFQGPAAKRRKGTSAQPIQDGGFRQTRISFEVHPSLLLDDDFLDMLGEMPYVNISDDESEESDEKMKTADDEEDEKQEKKSKITLSAIRSLFLHDYDNDDDEEELSGDTVASSSLSTTFTLIPTGASLNPTDEQEIDLRDMDEQDLKSLQKNDPFMYYSIPDRKRHLFFSNANTDSRISRPTRSQAGKESTEQSEGNNASKVSRRTRVSVEYCPSVFTEHIMDQLLEQQDVSEQGSNYDEVLSLLASLSGQGKS